MRGIAQFFTRCDNDTSALWKDKTESFSDVKSQGKLPELWRDNYARRQLSECRSKCDNLKFQFENMVRVRVARLVSLAVRISYSIRPEKYVPQKDSFRSTCKYTQETLQDKSTTTMDKSSSNAHPKTIKIQIFYALNSSLPYSNLSILPAHELGSSTLKREREEEGNKFLLVPFCPWL